jgi:hypothetical protein
MCCQTFPYIHSLQSAICAVHAGQPPVYVPNCVARHQTHSAVTFNGYFRISSFLTQFAFIYEEFTCFDTNDLAM